MTCQTPHTATSHAQITRLPPLLFATPSHPLLALTYSPEQSPSSFMVTSASLTIALLFHGHFCSSFTLTSASLTIALLFHAHFCLPSDRPPLSRPLLPPERSPSSFTLTSASLNAVLTSATLSQVGARAYSLPALLRPTHRLLARGQANDWRTTRCLLRRSGSGAFLRLFWRRQEEFSLVQQFIHSHPFKTRTFIIAS